jgi:TatD DNase family protein
MFSDPVKVLQSPVQCAAFFCVPPPNGLHVTAIPLELIDIGLNLTHDSFDHDRDAVLMRAAEAGVKRMLVTGSDVAHSQAALTLAHQYPGQLYATAGVHPHHAKDLHPSQLDELRALLKQSEVLAVGECGLDYFRNFSTHEQQEQAFRWQLELAAACDKPVFLHERDAHDAFVGILSEHLPSICGGVAHCFTGDIEQAERYLDLGLYVGITGWICDERRGQALREAVRTIPANRLLIETDAPYLIPRTLKPRPKSHRNEPMHLVEVLREIARCRGESMEALATQTTQNAIRLFNWPGWLNPA